MSLDLRRLVDQHTRLFQNATTLTLLHLLCVALVHHLTIGIIQHLTSRPPCRLPYRNLEAPTTTSSKLNDSHFMLSHGLGLAQRRLGSTMASMPAKSPSLKDSRVDGQYTRRN